MISVCLIWPVGCSKPSPVVERPSAILAALVSVSPFEESQPHMKRIPSLRSFTLVAIVLSLGLGAFGGTAEAGRARFGGGVRISGRAHSGVSVRFARPWRSFWRPRVWVGGSVWVGGYYYPRPYYYYYYPESVPSYYYGYGGYGNYGGSYYPVQPSAAPGVVAAAPQRPPMPSFGIGVAAGGSNVEGQGPWNPLVERLTEET